MVAVTAGNTAMAVNNNASSMVAALENLRALESAKKAFILGDMFEMGGESYNEHRTLIERALSLGASRKIFVGSAFYEHRQPGAEFYETTEAAKDALSQQPIRNALVLMKASRGMAFEKLADLL